MDDTNSLKGFTHSKLLVTAIDFGTTFSGYAYCMRNNPTKIYCHPLPSSGWRTVKAPTSVLFKADKTFHSFGYQANEYYHQHLNDDDGEDLRCWYFFQNFKMILYEHKDQINCDTEIADLNCEFQGKPKMKAIDVFSAVIKYLKETQYEHIKKSFFNLQKSDIQWVLTVPAIWDLKAKQFMRESALRADIENDQLTIALEPEAASLYCRKMPMLVEEHIDGDKSIATLPVGSKYIVLDQGGGTIDATVHEIISDKSLKEIHQACGGNWGSNFINREFYDFLQEIFGEDVIKYVEKNYPEDISNLMNRFEHKKITFYDVIERKEEKLLIPLNLLDQYKKMKGVDINEIIQETRYAGQLIIHKDKLSMHGQLFRSFYDKTISYVIQFLERLRQKESIKDINTLLMVGGFSRCKLLLNAIQKKFPDLNIVVPFDADLAVLKGAILYAFDPESIVCRVSQYTYGVPKLVPYNPLIYPVERKKQIIPGGRPMVDDVFDKHVEIGQVVDLGVFQPEHEYFPVMKDQTSVCFEFFASEERNPQFVTESCIRLGVLHFDLLRRSSKDGRVFLKINASGTELIAVAREESTNKEIQVYLSLI